MSYQNFLGSSISLGDPRPAVEGYKPFRCDHPSNLWRGGVCLYFKDHLSLALRPNLTTLDECLVCEIQNGSKRFFLTVLYRSPSQSNEQFSLFRQRWEETIINTNDCSPTIAIYIGDFNARNSEWWNGDSTNLQGTELAEPAAQYSLNQIIDGPAHILPNSASCIDLIFTTGTNFVTDSAVLPSLFSRCHHQLIFAKISFTTFFPSAYERRIWDFSRANINAIRQAVSSVDWDRAFNSLNIDERVKFLTECVLNVFYNFVPNKVITIRRKGTLWMTLEIKRMILEKAKIYRCYVKHGRSIADYQILHDITSKCKSAIKEAKSNYFSRLGESLNDPTITPKKYLSILHRFLHK